MIKPKLLSDYNINIFADGADVDSIKQLSKNSLIKGFTTNPTLMRNAGVENYGAFCKTLCYELPQFPFSFEVFSDDFDEMITQGRVINSYGANVYVKVPVTNTNGDFSGKVISTLNAEGIKLNVTAIMTVDQVEQVVSAVNHDTDTIISIFAGRIADTGRDPCPTIETAAQICSNSDNLKTLWASTREAYNLVQAENSGADIITITPAVIKKLDSFGTDLIDFSRDTVQMFFEDGQAAGFEI